MLAFFIKEKRGGEEMDNNGNRDGLGRIMGSRFEFTDYDEYETWEDVKVDDIRFPEHDNRHGEVTTYYLSKEELDAYMNKLYNK